MTVTAARGFTAAGVAAGLKKSGKPDVALVVNEGPAFAAAGVFTSNRVQAAPVLWSRRVLARGVVHAVVLNSGGANACTGPAGFQDTHRTAEHVAELLGIGAGDVAVCSTGLIGERLPMDRLLGGVEKAAASLDSGGGGDAADAICTTDAVRKTAVARRGDVTVGGMAKGAGMLAPGLATMLCVLTTDAVAGADMLDVALRDAVRRTFDRVDTDGCMSTNDTVLLLASGASGVELEPGELTAMVFEVCDDLARQLVADAEGATKDIVIGVRHAASEADAVTAARAVARSNLVKCAVHGQDPNWGRILSAVGTTDAVFDPDDIAVTINGVEVCRSGAAHADRALVDMTGRAVTIDIDLGAGDHEAFVRTTDLTAAYVHENSAYST